MVHRIYRCLNYSCKIDTIHQNKRRIAQWIRIHFLFPENPCGSQHPLISLAPMDVTMTLIDSVVSCTHIAFITRHIYYICVYVYIHIYVHIHICLCIYTPLKSYRSQYMSHPHISRI